MSYTVLIGGIPVGDGHPCFIIGEAGINHLGNVPITKQMVDVAVAAGCQAIKLQKRTVRWVYSPEELAAFRDTPDVAVCIEHARQRSAIYGYPVLSSEAEARLLANPEATTNGDLKFALEFNEPEYREIDAYCGERDILWSASPWDEGSVEFLSGFDVPFFKVASPSLTDVGLLKAIAAQGKPVVLSTGMSTMGQIRAAVRVLGDVPLVLLHCVSKYPADYEDLNLECIQTLKREFPGVPVGWSGHERGAAITPLAVALGACVVERHFTLDRTMPGSDQAASLEPDGLTLTVSRIRRFEQARGDGVKRVLPAEIPIMKKLRRKDTLGVE